MFDDTHTVDVVSDIEGEMADIPFVLSCDDGRVTSCGFCLDYRGGRDTGPRGEVVAPGFLGHL